MELKRVWLVVGAFNGARLVCTVVDDGVGEVY